MLSRTNLFSETFPFIVFPYCFVGVSRPPQSKIVPARIFKFFDLPATKNHPSDKPGIAASGASCTCGHFVGNHAILKTF